MDCMTVECQQALCFAGAYAIVAAIGLAWYIGEIVKSLKRLFEDKEST